MRIRLALLAWAAICAVAGCGPDNGSNQGVLNPTIRVHKDRYEFRGEEYRTWEVLQPTLVAEESAILVSVSVCASPDSISPVFDLLRERGQTNVAVNEFQEDCE